MFIPDRPSSSSLFYLTPSLPSKSTQSSRITTPFSQSVSVKTVKDRLISLRQLSDSKPLKSYQRLDLESPTPVLEAIKEGIQEETCFLRVDENSCDSTILTSCSALKIRKRSQDHQISSDASHSRTSCQQPSAGPSQAELPIVQLQVKQSSNACLEQQSFTSQFFSTRTKSSTLDFLTDQLDFLRQQTRSNSNKSLLGFHQLTSRTRAQVINILVSKLTYFKQSPQTLFLTIALLDRYLERASQTKQKVPKDFDYFYLIGCVCSLLASKFENGPKALSVSFIHDKVLTRLYKLKSIVEAEQHVVSLLGFKLSCSFFFNFLETQIRLLSHSLMSRKEYQQVYHTDIIRVFFKGSQALLLQSLYWPELAEEEPQLICGCCLSLCLKHMEKCVTHLKVSEFLKAAELELASACGLAQCKLDAGVKCLVEKMSCASRDFPGMTEAQILYEKSLEEAKRMMTSE